MNRPVIESQTLMCRLECAWTQSHICLWEELQCKVVRQRQRTESPPSSGHASEVLRQWQFAQIPLELNVNAITKVAIRIVENFPEPEFATLTADAFGGIQQESARLAHVLDREKSDTPKGQTAKTIRFGAFREDVLVGWSVGWMEKGRIYYMAHSGVAQQFQRTGVYGCLLQHVTQYAVSQGSVALRSQHSVLNNRMIIYKLKRGFHISGLTFDPQMGSLAELTRYLSGPRAELFADRVVTLCVPKK